LTLILLIKPHDTLRETSKLHVDRFLGDQCHKFPSIKFENAGPCFPIIISELLNFKASLVQKVVDRVHLEAEKVPGGPGQLVTIQTKAGNHLCVDSLAEVGQETGNLATGFYKFLVSNFLTG